MVRRSERGFTLFELTITVAIFFVVIAIVMTLQSEMLRFQKTMPLNYMGHPEVVTVLARIRKDVVDAYAYPSQFPSPPGTKIYEQTDKTLILSTLLSTGFSETVIWDFRDAGVAKRVSYNVGTKTEWIARGVPGFTVDSFKLPHGEIATRILANDENGVLAIDQIYEPRAR